jgi:hypothetical protein
MIQRHHCNECQLGVVDANQVPAGSLEPLGYDNGPGSRLIDALEVGAAAGKSDLTVIRDVERGDANEAFFPITDDFTLGRPGDGL